MGLALCTCTNYSNNTQGSLQQHDEEEARPRIGGRGVNIFVVPSISILYLSILVGSLTQTTNYPCYILNFFEVTLR